MDGLNLTIIKKLKLKLPPIKLQNQFVEFFKETDKTISKIRKSIAAMETLKKALMQQYFK